jgi:hypothetical protein
MTSRLAKLLLCFFSNLAARFNFYGATGSCRDFERVMAEHDLGLTLSFPEENFVHLSLD